MQQPLKKGGDPYVVCDSLSRSGQTGTSIGTTSQAGSIEPMDFPPPHRPLEAPPAERIRSFDEVVSRLTAAQARAEAERCLSCGRCGNCRSCLELFGCPAFRLEGGLVAIDPALCIGCGVCMQFCPNGAIGPEEVA